MGKLAVRPEIIEGEFWVKRRPTRLGRGGYVWWALCAIGPLVCAYGSTDPFTRALGVGCALFLGPLIWFINACWRSAGEKVSEQEATELLRRLRQRGARRTSPEDRYRPMRFLR